MRTKLLQVVQSRIVATFSILFALGLALSLIVSACSSSPSTTTATNTPNNTSTGVTLRIGYQKSATLLSYLKATGELERVLASSGASVTWQEFSAGLPILEAIRTGTIDLGYTGESPPVFAQSAGIPLLYVAYDPLSPQAEAIVVAKESPIKSLSQLKGKKIALTKGSNAHYLLVKALESVGLAYEDIQPIYLAPDDARLAFERRTVDAWAIWDPYLALVQEKAGARILVDGTNLVANRAYYTVAKSFVELHENLLQIVLTQISKTSNWAATSPTEVAKFLSSELGIDAAILEKAEQRRAYAVLPLSPEVINEQQKVADTFYQIKLIPQQVNISDVVWQGHS